MQIAASICKNIRSISVAAIQPHMHSIEQHFVRPPSGSLALLLNANSFRHRNLSGCNILSFSLITHIQTSTHPHTHTHTSFCKYEWHCSTTGAAGCSPLLYFCVSYHLQTQSKLYAGLCLCLCVVAFECDRFSVWFFFFPSSVCVCVGDVSFFLSSFPYFTLHHLHLYDAVENKFLFSTMALGKRPA